ncbi:MAG: spondin domain-containing protein [Salinibacter sp.]
MTLRALRSSLLAVLLSVGGLGLLVAGCDSSGGGGGPGTQNQAPTAAISLDNRSGLTAALSGAGSTDPDGSITSFEWRFGDDSTGTGETTVHEYDAGGTYPATLVVTDDDGASDSTQMDVMVSRTATTFDVTIENVGAVTPITKSGVFAPANEVNGDNAPPLTPGEAFEFSVVVGPSELPRTGMDLSFASMFIQSNDVYYAFGPGGLPLFEEGVDPDTDRDNTPIGLNSPVDVTDEVGLYDAGTEVDQEPGATSSDNQAPRQEAFDQGPDENGAVTLIEDIDGDNAFEDDANGNGQLDADNNEFEYPATGEVLNVTVRSQMNDETGSVRFTVRIENTGGPTTVNGAPFVISPGTFAAHFDQTPGGGEVAYPGHNAGQDTTAGPGIEAIAEDGRPTGKLDSDTKPGTPAGNHFATLDGLTGVTVPLSRGAFAAHSDEIEAFATGESASAGIEDVAEDGIPDTLGDELSASNSGIRDAGVFNVPDGASSPGPIPPGNSYSFEVEARPGDRLSLATMYIQSNDLFYAFSEESLPLFTNDAPINGDMTGQVILYDAGTEGDQQPGTGLDQAPRQSGTDTGPSGEGSVVRVGSADADRFLDDDGFDYEETPNILRVTITPRN